MIRSGTKDCGRIKASDPFFNYLYFFNYSPFDSGTCRSRIFHARIVVSWSAFIGIAGSGGKVLEETMVVWQNIVKSTRQPIENGKTYEDQSALVPDTSKADCSLKEVIFKDGSRWAK